MSNPPNEQALQSLTAMFDAWNEKDVSRIRAHLDRALSPEIVFVDPNYDIKGIDAFEKMVRALREQHPGHVAEQTSGIDAHHDICRYQWRVTLENGARQDGMDVTRLDANDKVLRVDGFFGPFPGKAA